MNSPVTYVCEENLKAHSLLLVTYYFSFVSSPAAINTNEIHHKLLSLPFKISSVNLTPAAFAKPNHKLKKRQSEQPSVWLPL